MRTRNGRQAEQRGILSLLANRSDEPDEAFNREKARRILIFRDMNRRDGAIHYGRVDTWDYQPSETEVNEMMVELETLKRKASSANARSAKKAG
jgi:hypothetical protein